MRRWALAVLSVVCIATGFSPGAVAMPDGSLADWTAQLEDPDPNKRARAARMIAFLGEKAAPAVPALTKLLEDDENHVRWNAAFALSQIGKPARPAVGAMLKAMEGKEGRGDGNVAVALARLGESVPAAMQGLVAALKSEHIKVREAALTAFMSIDRAPAYAIEGIVKVLAGDTSAMRRQAVWSLGGLGKSATPAAPALTEALKSEDGKLRTSVALALARIGCSTDAVRKGLDAACGHDELPTRACASYARWALFGVEGETVSLLVRAIQTEKSPSTYLKCLAKMGTTAKAGFDAITPLLAHENRFTRAAAILAVGRVGPGRKEVVSAATRLLEDKSDTVRRAAVTALAGEASRSEAAVRLVVKALGDKSNYVQSAAEDGLRSMGPDVAPVLLPMLIELLNDVMIVDLACEIIGGLGEAALPALDKLISLVENQMTGVDALAAIQALGRIGPKANKAIPAIERALNKKFQMEEIRAAAREALKKIRGE